MEKNLLKQFVVVFTFTIHLSNLISPDKDTLFSPRTWISSNLISNTEASKSKLFSFFSKRWRRRKEIVGGQGWGSLTDVNVFSLLSLWVAGLLQYVGPITHCLPSALLTVCQKSFCVNTAQLCSEQKSDAVHAAWCRPLQGKASVDTYCSRGETSKL